MAGLLRTLVRSSVRIELFLLLCVGDLKRQSNGKILLDHYRYKRRHFAGDERVCHQPVTAMRRANKMALSSVLAKVAKGRLQRFSRGAIAPKPDKVSVSSDTTA